MCYLNMYVMFLEKCLPPLNHVISGSGYPSAIQFITMALPNMRAVSLGSFIQRGGTRKLIKCHYSLGTIFHSLNQLF